MSGDLVIVKTFSNRQEAEIAQSYLDANGVTALLRADDEGGMASGFQFGAGGVLLFVLKEDLEKATQLLALKNVA